jgi:hypothetical protein
MKSVDDSCALALRNHLPREIVVTLLRVRKTRVPSASYV